MDAIVNTFSPFPMPPARQMHMRRIPRNVSSPSVRDTTSMATPAGTPRSMHTTRSGVHHHRQWSFDSAPVQHISVGSSVGVIDGGFISAAPSPHLEAHGQSTAQSTSSASTVVSDTRSTALSQKKSTASAAGHCSLPAMQYVAFALRELADLVNLQQHISARAAALKDRVSEAVQTCRAALDLEAKVKQLQVKTQQVDSQSVHVCCAFHVPETSLSDHSE